MTTEYFTERGFTKQELMNTIYSKYGSNVIITNEKPIKIGGVFGMGSQKGIEITGYMPKTVETVFDTIRKKNEAHSGLEQKNKTAFEDKKLEEEKKKILELARKSSSLYEIDNIRKQMHTEISETRKELSIELSEIRSLLLEQRNMKNDSIEKQSVYTQDSLHPALQKIKTFLEYNEFTSRSIENIVCYLSENLNLRDIENEELLEHHLQQYFADNITFYNPPVDIKAKCKKCIIVGTTGVGKTTTIAKLAALYGIDEKISPSRIRIFTIDNYRIGARQQIEIYGDIMGISVVCIETAEQLQQQLNLLHEVDYLFIDTIGRSPHDFAKMGAMRELLSSCMTDAQIFLTMNASAKFSDMEVIAQQFEIFGYSAIIITKFDETIHIGNCISFFIEKNKPIAYIAHGQRVPQDIVKADLTYLYSRLQRI